MYTIYMDYVVITQLGLNCWTFMTAVDAQVNFNKHYKANKKSNKLTRSVEHS